MKRIKINRDKCIGCLTCVTACVVSHESLDSRNRVVIDSKNKPAPIFCRHCELPECVYTCMSGAMSKNSETGYVTYDKKRCASCFMCIMACPYGVLKSDVIEQDLIMKCNMCVHRTKDGKAKPMCVEKCPMAAITFEEVEA
jgi:carbon-monoxide dehydrogenase iron sulfur subunit